MANARYKPTTMSKFTHNRYFQRGMRQKRLGVRVTVADTLIPDRTDQLCYEYGRQFAAMYPHISVNDVARATKDLEHHVIRAWNDFAIHQPRPRPR